MKKILIGSFLGYYRKNISLKDGDREKSIDKLKKRFSEIKEFIENKTGKDSHEISYFIIYSEENNNLIRYKKKSNESRNHMGRSLEFLSYQDLENKLNKEFRDSKDICVVLLANEYMQENSDIYYVNLCQRLKNDFGDKKQKVSIIVEIINEKYYELLSHFANKVICVKKFTPYILLNSLLQKNYLRVIKNMFYIDYNNQSIFSLNISGNYSYLSAYTYNELKKKLESVDDGANHIELLGFIVGKTNKIVLNPPDNFFKNRGKNFKKILMLLVSKILMTDKYKLDNNLIYSNYKLKEGDTIIAFADNYDSFIKKIKDIIKLKTESKDK